VSPGNEAEMKLERLLDLSRGLFTIWIMVG